MSQASLGQTCALWLLCNPTTLKVERESKKKKNPKKQADNHGWQPADSPSVCTSVACRRAQSSRPVSAYDLLSLVGCDATPELGGREEPRPSGGSTGTQRDSGGGTANINCSDASLNIGGQISG